MARYFQLESSEAPWGDYGSTLRSGFVVPKRSAANARVAIERTGPFIPPISFPFGAIVVTDAAKELIEAQRFTGMRFCRAKYAKIVKLDWHEWDLDADDPKEYPPTGEPEDYIEKHEHSKRTAALMPSIWAFDVPSTEGLQVMRSNRFRLDHAPDADIFREYMIHWISERMKVWLEKTFGDWVHCVPVKPE